MPPAQTPKIHDFKIEKYIVKGQAGTVYKAVYEQRAVALKLFNRDRENDGTILGYFANEELLLRKIAEDSNQPQRADRRGHPHIAEWVASNLVRPPYYLATHYVEQRLERVVRWPQPPAFVVRVVRQLANALDYLHYRIPDYTPTIHRDVKPGNIMLDATGDAVLIDLSIARHPHYFRENEPGMGTFQYMAPEQYEGLEEPASDQFSLGLVALQLLTGQPLLRHQQNDALADLARLRASDYAAVRKQLGSRIKTAEVIIRALAYNPRQRFDNCEQFAYHLEHALRADGQIVGTTDLIHPVRPTYADHSRVGYVLMAVTGIVAVLLLVLGLVLPPVNGQLPTGVPTAPGATVTPGVSPGAIMTHSPVSSATTESKHTPALLPPTATLAPPVPTTAPLQIID